MPPRKLMLLFFGALAVGIGCPLLVMKFMRPDVPDVPAVAPVVVPVDVERPLPLPVEKPVAAVKTEPMFAQPAGIYPTGYIVRGGQFIVMMSDGSRITEQDNDEVGVDGATVRRVSMLTRNYIVFDGVRVWFKPRSVGAGVESTPVRQDGVPPAVVSASVPTGSRSGAGDPSVAAAASADHATPPPQRNSGSWFTDENGIQRLVAGADKR